MADNMIKDFVKKQTTAISIGVPKQRPADTPVQAAEPVREVEHVAAAPAAKETPAVKGHVGRPKSDIEKLKLSVYVPAEAKEKLIKIQHHNYKPSLNDVLMEAIVDIIKKYGE